MPQNLQEPSKQSAALRSNARQLLFMLVHQTLEHGLGASGHLPPRNQRRDFIDHAATCWLYRNVRVAINAS